MRIFCDFFEILISIVHYDYSFYISLFHHHEKEITQKSYKFGKKKFQNLINRGESNKIIAKYFRWSWIMTHDTSKGCHVAYYLNFGNKYIYVLR
jgi:hypothetical protein